MYGINISNDERRKNKRQNLKKKKRKFLGKIRWCNRSCRFEIANCRLQICCSGVRVRMKMASVADILARALAGIRAIFFLSNIFFVFIVKHETQFFFNMLMGISNFDSCRSTTPTFAFRFSKYTINFLMRARMPDIYDVKHLPRSFDYFFCGSLFFIRCS